ncbi:efflux RND transporter periplasmic adaptor subunit [Runella slithyformis]|uniref:Efflux transporter, RND family, MFP subunit n=1 Tax=Runella slithyformis (strain ATCC 29530 / DSM 19594 / LMG 11500 / NCIMB 11436 / LSU 4) TaxID=761193 RepID=A0A7U3ZIW5_RUNSL|nr:efflux RND transporter periplasmic adaptor subunit [Runella slithyformis]AEI48062.1 efflux transporter, RND family, MFP subunit [Runella slithyformis DSM 19594]
MKNIHKKAIGTGNKEHGNLFLSKDHLAFKQNYAWLLLLVFIAQSFLLTSAYARHDHDHGDGAHSHGEETAKTEEVKMQKSEAVSDKYEAVLKYEHLHANEPEKMTVYLADPVTNRAIAGASLTLSTSLDSKAKFGIIPKEPGIYEVTATFSRERTFSLTLAINGSNGSDMLLLKGINVGHTEAEHVHEESRWQEGLGDRQTWAVLGIGILIGLLVMFFAMKIRNRTLFMITLLGWSLFPLANYQPASAQHDHDHEHEGESADRPKGPLTDEFEVPKETQFLFEVLTQKADEGHFLPTTQLNGTVIPSSTGLAVVQPPQAGRIISLNVRVGQKVSKGQTLAVVEQTLDATALVSLQAERNTLEAELSVARKEYDRLKKIEDIAAKRDVSEAEARLQKAQDNLKVFNDIAPGGKGTHRRFPLVAPISGLVSPFTVAIGTMVGTGDTVFQLTNLSKVYVEAQVFEQDAESLTSATGYEVICQREAGQHRTRRVRLLSSAQSVNANQSQKALFEVENPEGDFKVGEFVTIRAQKKSNGTALAVPNAALSEVNGKPCVFVKESPEIYRIEYVATGHNNGDFTTILKGIHNGDKVVVASAYQVKMIFMNR